MAFGSLIGFALVFVLITWAASACSGLLFSASVGVLRRQGSAAEKRAAALALVIPPVLGSIVALSLAGHSALPAWLGGGDHCEGHGHHLHLCLVHGGEWASRAWAASLISALGALVFVRLIQQADALIRGSRKIRVVERSSTLVRSGSVPVLQAPSRRAFCFVTGILSPRIFVSSSLWERSTPEEREAMLGHEYAHVANGDLWRSPLLSCCALVGAPLLANQFVRLWSEATERLCDRQAADRTGDSTPLAAALVNIVRGPRTACAMSFLPKPESVKERVIAVLTQERTGLSFAHQLVHVAASLVLIVTVATALLADPLHHALETLFDII